MSYLYSFVVYLYVNGGGLIASVGGSWFVCCCLPLVVWFLFGGGGGFPLPVGAWGGLRCFVVALPGPSMWLFFKIYDDTVTFCVHCIYKESKNLINLPDYVI